MSSGGGSRATLRVFAKRAMDVGYAEIEVDAGASVAGLVKAIIAELRLDVSPSTVTITMEGTDKPLDARKSLRDAGIAHGVSIIVAVLAPQAATPTAETREFVPAVAVRTNSTAARFVCSLCSRVTP